MFGTELSVVLTVITGYLLGSVNTSLIVGRIYGVDIRKHGSGNAGATNTLRTLGKKAAIFVSIGDISKGVISCLVGLYLIGEVSGIGLLGVMSAGVACVMGHNWPVYFGFKGGKGILTSLSVVFMMDWRIGFILLGVFLIVLAISRYVSLGSIIAAASFPAIAAIPVFDESPVFIIFAAVVGILAIIRHHPNIKRIINGTESKFGSKKATGKFGGKE